MPVDFNAYKIDGQSLFNDLEIPSSARNIAGTLTDFEPFGWTDSALTFKDYLYKPFDTLNKSLEFNQYSVGTTPVNFKAVQKGYLPLGFTFSGSNDTITVTSSSSTLFKLYTGVQRNTSTTSVDIFKGKTDDNVNEYIYISDGQTQKYYSNVSQGLVDGVIITFDNIFNTLGYVPKCLTVVLGGAGGGGSGGSNRGGGAGGGGGAIGAAVIYFSSNILGFKILMGKYGESGAGSSNGSAGGDSQLKVFYHNYSSAVLFTAGGGGGGVFNTVATSSVGGKAGKITRNTFPYYYYLGGVPGGDGGRALNDSESPSAGKGHGVARTVINSSIYYSQSIYSAQSAGGETSWWYDTNTPGAGGGSLAKGADAKYTGSSNGNVGNLGSGGSAGFGLNKSGGTGGRGWCIITY